MDQINRDFVIGELVKNARSSRVQFILITPNPISHTISLDHDIKIIRLENPERRQTVT
jgi:chromosome segregation ATPase